MNSAQKGLRLGGTRWAALPAKDHGVAGRRRVECLKSNSVAPCRQKPMSRVRQCIAAAPLVATMARKKKLRASNRQPRAASTERTRSSASIQNQHATPPLLLATKAGQERCSNTPCKSKKNPHLASTAALEISVFTADEGWRRACRRRLIEEDSVACRRISLRPPEQRNRQQQPYLGRDPAARI
jgi:hypothetical protein